MRICYINLHFTCLLTNRDDNSINIDTVLAADDDAVTCDVAVYHNVSCACVGDSGKCQVW